jgi:hypothetical protein
MRCFLLALVVVLAACEDATSTVAPPRATIVPPTSATIVPPTSTPVPTMRPGTDIVRILTETMDYACMEPAEDWCGKYVRKTAEGVYQLEPVPPNTLIMATSFPDTPAGRRKAMVLCKTLAASPFDEEGLDLGYEHVSVLGGATELVSCDWPSL